MIQFLKTKLGKWLIGSTLALGAVGGASTLGGTADANFQLTNSFKGYYTKVDPTNTPSDVLVAGSQNVLISDNEKVETRAGIELFGAASTTATAIQSDFDWKNSTGGEIVSREANGVLQFLPTATSTDLRNFENLLGGLNATATSSIRFATVWSQTEQLDILLFVNGTPTMYEWSGGQGTFASDTSNTIVLNEDVASSTQRFFINGTRQIRVKDADGTWQTFTYTGQSAKTFTGVTPDPTTFTFNTGALVVQAVRSNTNTPSSNFDNDTIKVLQNQVWLGSATSRRVYISKDTSYTDFSYSSPRIAGEGALLTLDDITIGFESPDDKSMLVFSGKDRVYQVNFEISPGSSADREVPVTRPLLVSSGQGAISQELIAKIKKAVVWVSNNKELVELGQVENLPSPQAVAISDPIKPDFTDASFANGEIEFWRNNIFITDPSNSKVFIFDLSKRFWQPPQVMGIRRITVYNDLFYGHSNSVPESYTLFSGLSDNGNPISFKAHFSYQNGGRRDVLKNFDKFFTELYIAGNTKVNVSLLYEWKGAKNITTYELDGASQDFLYIPNASAALGVNSLGTNPLGGQLEEGENTPKYRRYKPTVPTDYFEYQVRFETEGDDNAFQILSFGPNSIMSNNAPQKITK